MIALDSVSKAYRTESGRRVVLDNANAEFPSGCNVGVLGVNGAGKSTLIRLLAGSEMPDRGSIRRDGRVSFPLGYAGTFHGTCQAGKMSPLSARVYGADVRRTISSIFEFSEIEDYFDRELSG